MNLSDIITNILRTAEEDQQCSKIVEFIEENFTAKKANQIDWIDEWLDLFPRGVKSGGKLLRSDRNACLTKMSKFVKANKYPKDLIMRVTQDYLYERSLEDYSFTKCATYLIDKQGEGSELAALCEGALTKKPEKTYAPLNSNGLI